MKKVFLLVFMSIMLFVPITQVHAEDEIAVYVDGSRVSYDSKPFIENGSVLVPLRQTFEAIYADVDWNPTTKTVTLTVGSTTAYIDGSPIEISVAPKIINSRTYVPLRFVAESFGADVDWVSSERTVYINSFYDTFEYDPNYVETDYVAYSSGNLGTLLNNIANGNVVIINGEYYATPEYATALYHAFNSSKDNSTFDREGTFEDDIDDYEWVGGGVGFDKLYVSEEKLTGIDLSTLEEVFPGYYDVYGFFDGTTPIYLVPDMTDEFYNSGSGAGTFSGIKMEWDDGVLFFYVPDLDRLGIEY